MSSAGKWKIAIAWKYFSSRRNKQRGSLLLSVSVLALGLMIIITVISIMQGLQQGYLQDIIEVEAYHMSAGPMSRDEMQIRLEQVSALENIALAVPYGETEIMIIRDDGESFSARIRGLDPAAAAADSGFFSQVSLIRGSFDLADDSLIIGSDFAAKNGISVGDRVKAVTVVRGRIVRAVPSVRYLDVSGIYRTGYPDIDSALMFTNLHTISVMGIGHYYIGFKTDALEELRGSLTKVFGDDPPPFAAWMEKHESFYAALMLEKYSMLIVLMLIFVVVAINVRSSFERFLYEKRDEIGIMKTLGASTGEIRQILMYQGMFMSVFSIIPGLVLGVLVAGNINALLHGLDWLVMRITPFSLGITNIVFPVMLSWNEILISIGMMVLFILYAVVSASRTIGRFSPMEIFHYE